MNSHSHLFDDGGRRLWGTLGSLGIATGAAAAFVTPERAWASGLLITYYLATLGLGGAVFIATANVTGAGWHIAIRRIPEALTNLLPISGLLLIGLLLAQSGRYEWHAQGHADAGTFWFKELWLSSTFLLARAAAYLVLWMVFATRLVSVSRSQDRLLVTAAERINTTTSAVFLALFAVTFSLAAVDWIMALEPLWFSTMWGVYHFSGMFQATLAAIIIVGVLLRSGGQMQGIFRDDHLHDLGKLLLGFSCFWMYIWFCQYMLIWYSNIPEETSYFTSRLQGSWGPMVIASVVLNWVIPFFALLPRASKRNGQIMLRVAGIVLIGRWVDLSVMVYPPVVGDAPVLGIPEVAGVVAGIGIAVWMFTTAFSRASPMPVRDPLLEESLHYVS
ncbi:MAG: hypothetical protein ACK5Q5_05665 [Planctomycetaceae bacterium]